MRTCLGCRETKNKAELIRIVREPDGHITLDAQGKKNGRGAYLCKDPACLRKALKSGAVARALKTEIPADVAESVADAISGIPQ